MSVHAWFTATTFSNKPQDYFLVQYIEEFILNYIILKLKEFDKVFQKFNEASVLTHKALILPAYNFSLLI